MRENEVLVVVELDDINDELEGSPADVGMRLVLRVRLLLGVAGNARERGETGETTELILSGSSVNCPVELKKLSLAGEAFFLGGPGAGGAVALLQGRGVGLVRLGMPPPSVAFQPVGSSIGSVPVSTSLMKTPKIWLGRSRAKSE